MITNNLRSSLRNLAREKRNTIINILGLSLGITGSLVLYLFISHANSFDRYHSKFDRIYRVVSQSKGNDGIQYTQAIPQALPDAFKLEFSAVEEVAFTSYRRGSLVGVIRSGELKKYEEPKGLAFSQPSFFRIFDRKLIIGSVDKSLDDPNEAVISRRWALKYFGKEDAVGEIVSYENAEYTISGVMEDFPTNTDLPFDLILSWTPLQENIGWGNYSDTDNCYVLLKDNADVSSVSHQMPFFAQKYTGDSTKNGFIVQPLGDLHSDSRFGNYNSKLPKQAQVVFSVIAIFLLITACVNFVNMATAQAVRRTKEVSIRKILGGGRAQLILQFLLEAFLVVTAAIFVSLGGAQLFLTWFNPLMDLSLALNLTWPLILFLIVLLFTITFLSGIYPAWLMSSFRPTDAMKNVSRTGKGSFLLRRGLVVLQFTISQLFIIGTLVLVSQMDFMYSMDIGFDKEDIVAIPIPAYEQNRKMRTMRDELMRLPGISSASLAYAPPSYKAVVGTGVSMDAQEPFGTQVKHVDANYTGLFGIQLIAGVGLADLDSASGLLVNEKFVEVAGLSDPMSIIGKEVLMWDRHYPIKGVVRNFNTQSLSEPIEPVVLLNSVNDYHFVSVKMASNDHQATLTQIKRVWESTYPEYVFQYTYLDDQVKSLYRGETKITSMLTVFAGVAIFIGCLGLLGLVTFMANSRTKEIGVRKLLGASVEHIVLLFTSELGKLQILGFALAAPIAGFVMNQLLQEFAYRIDLGPGIFLLGLTITFAIAFVTIAYRSFRAATANPVDSLKSE